MIGLDDQFKYDFSDWYALLLALWIPCACLGMLVAALRRREETEDEKEKGAPGS